jgi:hypothetical protein
MKSAGKLPSRPQGRLIAGWCAQPNGAVLGGFSRPRNQSRRSAHGPAALSRSRAAVGVSRRGGRHGVMLGAASSRPFTAQWPRSIRHHVMAGNLFNRRTQHFPYRVASAELPMTSRQILLLALTTLLSRRGPRHSLTSAGGQPYPCIHDVRWLRQPGDGVPP